MELAHPPRGPNIAGRKPDGICPREGLAASRRGTSSRPTVGATGGRGRPAPPSIRPRGRPSSRDSLRGARPSTWPGERPSPPRHRIRGSPRGTTREESHSLTAATSNPAFERRAAGTVRRPREKEALAGPSLAPPSPRALLRVRPGLPPRQWAERRPPDGTRESPFEA